MAQDTPDVHTPASEKAKQAMAPPDFSHPSRLALVRRQGQVAVGMTYPDEALAVFAEPPGSYEKSELPPSIPAPYEARGWQRKGEGFGAILYKGRIAAAVYQLERVDEDRVQEILHTHEQAFGQPTTAVDGKFVRFWFWRPDPSGPVLMLCATEIQPKKLNLTLSVGTPQVMEALGMTPESAAGTKDSAERLISKQRSGLKPKTENSSNQDGS